MAAIGIADQGETVVVWDRSGGVPIHRAIVWQDRCTAADRDDLRRGGAETPVRARTGLLLDPYVSATKPAWLLDAVPGARRRAKDGRLAFGILDCFLLWEPRRRLHARHGGRAAGASARLLAGRAGPGADAAAVRRYLVCRWWPTSTANGAVSVAPPRNETVTGIVAPACSAAVGFQQVRW